MTFRALLGGRDGGAVPVIRRKACLSCKESELSSRVGFGAVVLCFKPVRTFSLGRTRWVEGDVVILLVTACLVLIRTETFQGPVFHFAQ